MGNKEDQAMVAMKKIAVVAFAAIVFLPAMLGVTGKIFDKKVDVALNGYTDSVSKPALTASSFYEGSFQSAFTAWFDANVKPRGVFTRSYATIRYSLFDLGNRPIGYHKDIFEPAYIESELALTSSYDMSQEENRAGMEAYVEKLGTLQKKLAAVGKYLYVYVPANKANMHLHNIPEKYKAMANSEAVNPNALFDKLMRETSIPYLNTVEIGRTLEYPAFYNTGIHWSRPFEQTVSQRILSDLRELTGKNYRQIQFGEINVSTDPFWRDNDVFDLLNVWSLPDITYYEYSVNQTFPKEFDRLGVLLSGTSFADGLRSDILSAYPTENVYYVNRSDFFQKPNGEIQAFYGDWNALHLSEYLDKIDVVIIENITPELNKYSHGFVEHLLKVLEEYVPAERSAMQMFDGDSDAGLDDKCVNGFWWKEDGFVWARKDSVILLQDVNITEKGLQINFDISSWTIQKHGVQDVHIYVNGKKVFSRQYNAQTGDCVVIPPDQLATSVYGDDIYEVSVLCSKDFVPKELGINEDTRDLAITFTYIGRVK